MRVALLAIVGLLVLGGGGAGVYFYFQHPAEASIGNTGDHKAAKEAHKGSAEDAMDHEFVQLDPLILPIIDERGVTQTVSLVIVIEVGDKNKAKDVEKMSPRLKDAFIQDMYGVLNKRQALRDGVVQVGMIKDRLRDISHRVLGDEIVEDVLLQVVQQRKI